MCLVIVYLNESVSEHNANRIGNIMPLIVAHVSEECPHGHMPVESKDVTVKFAEGGPPEEHPPFRIQLMALPRALCVDSVAEAIQRRIRKLHVTSEELSGSFVNLVPG